MKGGTRFSIASLLGMCLFSFSCGGPSTTTSPACDQVTGYSASSTTALSFATDIQPILTAELSCGLGTACHGSPGVALDSLMTRRQSFVGALATVKALLLEPSFNAPSMNLVVPKSVGTSFLAYKLSGKDGLTCVQSKCTPHTSIGTITACGDPMPNGGAAEIKDNLQLARDSSGALENSSAFPAAIWVDASLRAALLSI